MGQSLVLGADQYMLPIFTKVDGTSRLVTPSGGLLSKPPQYWLSLLFIPHLSLTSSHEIVSQINY